MKKSLILFFAMAMVAVLPSCKNQNKKAEEAKAEEQTMTVNEQYLYEDFKLNVQNLVESTKLLKPAPFVSVEGGSVKLSEKEKKAKPKYLLSPDCADNLVTLSQKYRAVAMLGIDKTVADLYGMPSTEYQNALNRLTVDINDPALKTFADRIKANEEIGPAVSAFFDEEIEAERANMFWEALAAAMVEQIYVCTQNINKFMPMFDDQAASDITYNFILVKDGFQTFIKYYPEMESLNKVIEPLYVINAITAEQLRTQLIELKGEIEVIRVLLLK